MSSLFDTELFNSTQPNVQTTFHFVFEIANGIGILGDDHDSDLLNSR